MTPPLIPPPSAPSAASAADAGGVTSAAPRYRQIADQLRANIASGAYAVGTMLATEIEICSTYGVSRHTAREALRVLTDEGMIERRQGHGTRVIAAEPHAFQRSISTIGDLLQYGANTHLRIISSKREQAVNAIATLLDCAEGAPCIHLHGVRSERHAPLPFCVTDIYRIAGNDALTKRLSSVKGAVYAIIDELKIGHVERVEQSIRADRLSSAAALVLGVKAKDPCLTITRRYLDRDSKLILVAVSQHRAVDYVYNMELNRSN